MAAVLPFLEQQDDPAETALEKEWFSRVTPQALQGLGAPSQAQRVLDASHSRLLRLQWGRNVTFEQLEGLNIRARTVRDKKEDRVRLDLVDDDGNFVKIPGPDWNVAGTKGAFILSWTSKMACPSFSLPAGPMQFGGSCPGSDGGQTIVSESDRRKTQKRVLDILGQPVEMPLAVCQFCYAEKGNYAYGNRTAESLIRLLWTKASVLDGQFLDIMDHALRVADYEEEGDVRERHPGLYFRIHDSGDFFSPEYLAMWKAVADDNPEVTFWAPTRIWATKWGIDAVNEINRSPRNLQIRPSQYMVNTAAPQIDLGPGWSDWTTVYAESQQPDRGLGPHRGGPFAWNCQAYAVEDDAHTCLRAIAPDGKPGCRACWRHPDLSVNYTFH